MSAGRMRHKILQKLSTNDSAYITAINIPQIFFNDVFTAVVSANTSGQIFLHLVPMRLAAYDSTTPMSGTTTPIGSPGPGDRLRGPVPSPDCVVDTRVAGPVNCLHAVGAGSTVKVVCGHESGLITFVTFTVSPQNRVSAENVVTCKALKTPILSVTWLDAAASTAVAGSWTGDLVIVTPSSVGTPLVLPASSGLRTPVVGIGLADGRIVAADGAGGITLMTSNGMKLSVDKELIHGETGSGGFVSLYASGNSVVVYTTSGYARMIDLTTGKVLRQAIVAQSAAPLPAPVVRGVSPAPNGNAWAFAGAARGRVVVVSMAKPCGVVGEVQSGATEPVCALDAITLRRMDGTTHTFVAFAPSGCGRAMLQIAKVDAIN